MAFDGGPKVFLPTALLLSFSLFAQTEEPILAADQLFAQGERYKAEALYREGLAAAQEPFQVARILTRLAHVMLDGARLHEAEQYCRRALALHSASDPVAKALTMGLLGSVRTKQGDLKEAERLLRGAIQILETNLGPHHPQLAVLFARLSIVLQAQDEPARAEPLARRGLAILEKTLGAEHRDTAQLRHNLANIYLMQKRCSMAELLIRDAISATEKELGDNHHEVIRMRISLVGSLLCSKQVDQAEHLLEPTLRSAEVSLGPQDPDLVTLLVHSEQISRAKSRYPEAAAALDRAIRISRETGADHDWRMTSIYREYAWVLRKLHRVSEAEQVEGFLKTSVPSRSSAARSSSHGRAY